MVCGARGTNVLSHEEAVAKVEELLCEIGRHLEGGLVLLPESTVTLPYGWMFLYTSKLYSQTRALTDAIAGNGPIVVIAATGEVVTLGTALPPDEALAQFERTRGIGRFPRRPRMARVELPLATTSLYVTIDERTATSARGGASSMTTCSASRRTSSSGDSSPYRTCMSRGRR